MPSHQFKMRGCLSPVMSGLALLALSCSARASIAYGSINNFDTVNDTGHECHGFEIEIEDCRSTDVTYTYNYNHYGVPIMSQDDSVAGHPKCIIRWESKKNADGSWSAYTAIPTGPISPTNGHQFTNPALNFGGEHFGVGYRAAVGTIRYHWLIDDGTGNLVKGGAVQVSTPRFTYLPAAGGAPAQMQAEIEPPEPPEIPVKEFGPAVWVKEIRTTSHNNKEVKLRDLISDDPDDPDDKNWRNGEPDEIEVEWQLLQKEFSKPDGGANGCLVAAAENLDEGDEIVTRRYEFYEYVGPFDDESGEAKGENVGDDDLHGEGIKEINGVEVDLSEVLVVGEYKGAQMAAADADGALGLIEHVSEGEEGMPYTARRLVVEGPLPFTATLEGDLPDGMEFDEFTGILSGTPVESGEFYFSVTATDGAGDPLTRSYTLPVSVAGGELPPASLVDTTVFPAAGGETIGDGSYAPGSEVTLVATPAPGFRFVNWTDNGRVVGTSTSHTFTIDINHSLIANFEIGPPLISISVIKTGDGTFSFEWPSDSAGWVLQESSNLHPDSWQDSTVPVATSGATKRAAIAPVQGTNRFFRLRHP